MLERKHIKFIEIHRLFTEISLALGFSEQDIETHSANLAELIALWQQALALPHFVFPLNFKASKV